MSPRVACSLPGVSGYGGSPDSNLNRYCASLALRTSAGSSVKAQGLSGPISQAGLQRT